MSRASVLVIGLIVMVSNLNCTPSFKVIEEDGLVISSASSAPDANSETHETGTNSPDQTTTPTVPGTIGGIVSPTLPPQVRPPEVPPPKPPSPVMNPVPEPEGEVDFSAGSTKVCPSGCDYTNPADAVRNAKDDDIIEILAGDYKECLSVRASRVTIRGVKGLAHFHSKICDQKGIVVNHGTNNRLENLELSDAYLDDYSGAGIRQDANAKNLTIKNLYFHNSQFGLLATSRDDEIRIESSRFERVGVKRDDGEISVPIYMAGPKSFFMTNSKMLTGVEGASMIKSRAQNVTIDCSVIANLDGPDNYSIDLQLGQNFTLKNSVIEQGTKTDNPSTVVYGTGSRGDTTNSKVVITGNTFINDFGSGNLLKFQNGMGAMNTITGNTFIGAGTHLTGGEETGPNTYLESRPASLGAYPALPKPGPCTL